MAESKTYLTVPYAQKDAAKALGAKWDAQQKKWFVPGHLDIALFAQWPVAAVTEVDPSAATKPQSIPSSAEPVLGVGVFTYPADPAFQAYAGDAPPWD